MVTAEKDKMLIDTTIEEAEKMLRALKKPLDTHITIIIDETEEQAEEVDSEAWDKSFAETQDVLGELADEARREHKEGKTKRMEWD